MRTEIQRAVCMVDDAADVFVQRLTDLVRERNTSAPHLARAIHHLLDAQRELHRFASGEVLRHLAGEGRR